MSERDRFNPPGECPRCGKEMKYPMLDAALAEKIAEAIWEDVMTAKIFSNERFLRIILRVRDEAAGEAEAKE